MVYFIAPIVIGLVIMLVLSFANRDASKVDKGAELNYFKLSYRRKMIRTLTNLPIIILSLILISTSTDGKMFGLIGLLFLVIFSTQLMYNFTMWKKRETY